MNDPEVKALVTEWATFSNNFWSDENAKTNVEANVKKNYADIVMAVGKLQKHWKAGELTQSGFYWGQYWSLLMGGKPATVAEVVEHHEKEKVHKKFEYDDDMLEKILQ